MQDIKFPFFEHVGATLKHISGGYAETELIVKEHHLQHLGFVYGGVITTMLDNTGWYAAMSQLDDTETSVTMQINIDYLKPSKCDRLICKAIVIQKGRRRSFVEIKLFDDCDSLVAVASGNYAVLAQKQ